MTFPNDENEMVNEPTNLFRLGLHCTKGVVDVFETLMVIWERDRERFQIDLKVKRVPLFLYCHWDQKNLDLSRRRTPLIGWERNCCPTGMSRAKIREFENGNADF